MKKLPYQFTFKCDEHSIEQCKELGIRTNPYDLKSLDCYYSVYDNRIASCSVMPIIGLTLISLYEYTEQKPKDELIEEIERLEALKNFFKKQAVFNKRKASFMSDILDIESMYIDMYYNTAENLRKLNWFQKLIIGYDKLNKSNERIKDNNTRATSYKTNSGGFSQSTYTIEPIDANEKFEIVWGEGSGEGFY
jgi:hypothetical protein